MPDSVAKLLSKYKASVQSLALSTRRLVHDVVRGAQEQTDSSGQRIGYGLGPKMTDTVCVIMLSKKGVKLGLFDGASLADPADILRGGGKRHRHVPLYDPAEVTRPAVRALLKAALAAAKARRLTRA